YRRIQPRIVADPKPKARPARALSDGERFGMLEILNSPRFGDRAPAEVYATLLDEGIYMASERTMYRILADSHEVRERRNQLRHPAYAKPELLASEPNRVWTWDITKLRGPVKGTWFNLYVILDIFSRVAVGWMVAPSESARLAKRLIKETIRKQDADPAELVLHADRGAAMRSKLVEELLSDLGVTQSHSRPRVSNDNPFSESQFRTLKYAPSFPARFGCIADARTFCSEFFDWYNNEHRHSGIGYLTPATVHSGQAADVRERRVAILLAAHAAHPDRFVHGIPQPPPLPLAAWINKPDANSEASLNNSESEVSHGA
ncbi:MAG: IS3 family transposase, partial [Candidatus Dormibacteria bacterium]